MFGTRIKKTTLPVDIVQTVSGSTYEITKVQNWHIELSRKTNAELDIRRIFNLLKKNMFCSIL